MECQASDSKKLFKVFEASKRKKVKKRKGVDETNSGMTDDSSSLVQATSLISGKESLQDVATAQGDGPAASLKRERNSSTSMSPSPDGRDSTRSRRFRHPHRNGVSLALKAGLISTPRSSSPQKEGDCTADISQGQDSFIYTFLEDAIKKDKRKHRHARRQEEQKDRDNIRENDRVRDHIRDENDRDRDRDRDHDHERVNNWDRDHKQDRDDRDHDRNQDREDRDRDRNQDREDRDRDHNHDRDRDRDRNRNRDRGRDTRDHTPTNHEHRHRHRRHRDEVQDRTSKGKSLHQAIDQALLFETFAKLCSTITENNAIKTPLTNNDVVRNHSHKSLQCEAVMPPEPYEFEKRPPPPVRQQQQHVAPLNPASPRFVRSYENMHELRGAVRSPTRILNEREDKYNPPYEKHLPRYASKLEVVFSRRDVDRYRDYPATVAKSYMDHSHRHEAERRDYWENDEVRAPPVERRGFEDDKRRYCDQKTSRSFDIHREPYPEDERCRPTARSDSFRKRYEDVKINRDRRYDDRDKFYDRRREKYYDVKEREFRDRHCTNIPSKDRRSKRNIDRDRMSVVSRDDDKERDRFSERERDSGLSVADGDTSTISGRSNYLRAVKQEIVEQREAMDKMMKLWKELMRCFKGMSQNQGQDKSVQESAATMQESAAAQLRLWRECMRRYETVARDVGDTDARLMEEITKQRSEMAEMATMWQECLQRYRDMSTDFNSLKKQLASESPTRPAPPLVCAEGEGSVPVPPYPLPPSYHPPPMCYQMGAMGYPGGSPLRSRASAPPPAWWWCNEQPQPARRRSSPNSRGSHSRERRHRHKERPDNSRSKEKSSSKQSAARSEHRHRKR